MKKIVKTDVYQITAPNSTWTIPLQRGMYFHELNAVYDSTGTLMDVQNTVSVENDTIIIDFGFDEYNGYAKYSWLEYVPDNYNESQSVVVNINNSDNCGTSTGGEIIIKTFNDNIEFKIAELSADTVIFEYSIKNSTGKIEAGKVVIINESTLSIAVDRFASDALLPLEFTTNKNNNVINIKITSTDVINNTIKYKTTIF